MTKGLQKDTKGQTANKALAARKPVRALRGALGMPSRKKIHKSLESEDSAAIQLKLNP